jgi:hypothetical protein
VLPRRIFGELRRRLDEPERPLPQLIMTSTLLGALVVPYLLRVALERPVRGSFWLDLEEPLRPAHDRALEHARRWVGLLRLWLALRNRPHTD